MGPVRTAARVPGASRGSPGTATAHGLFPDTLCLQLEPRILGPAGEGLCSGSCSEKGRGGSQTAPSGASLSQPPATIPYSIILIWSRLRLARRSQFLGFCLTPDGWGLSLAPGPRPGGPHLPPSRSVCMSRPLWAQKRPGRRRFGCSGWAQPPQPVPSCDQLPSRPQFPPRGRGCGDRVHVKGSVGGCRGVPAGLRGCHPRRASPGTLSLGTLPAQIRPNPRLLGSPGSCWQCGDQREPKAQPVRPRCPPTSL